MITSFLSGQNIKEITMLSIILAFLASVFSLKYLSPLLPHDQGRAFAVNGQLSKGKPRGAGIIFIIVFVLLSLLFVPVNTEFVIYSILIAAAMFSGYLDDGSDKPWSELLKGIVDFAIAVIAAITYLNFNPDAIGILMNGRFFQIHPFIFGALMTLLIWVSINVTNCSDGVDGLCGSLSVATLLTIYFIFVINGQNQDYAHAILLMIACILGYLWFNVSPSNLLMGDAGSRAIGFFIALAVVKSNSPLLYPIVAFMLLIDGGLGLIKLTLLRLFKFHILKNIRTPIHDFARKSKGWADPQVVFRFVVIQILISFLLLYFIM